MLLALDGRFSWEVCMRKSSQAVQNSMFSSLNSDLRKTQKAVFPSAGEETSSLRGRLLFAC